MSEWEHVYKRFDQVERHMDVQSDLIEKLTDRCCALEESLLSLGVLRVGDQGRLEMKPSKRSERGNPPLYPNPLRETPIPDGDPRKVAPGKRPS